MATTIITKNGSGPPEVGDLVQGELAVDLTNKTLYSKDSSGNVFKVGDTGGGSPGTFTDLVATNSFTSPGIDDNATSTAITIDANENVGIGETPASNHRLVVKYDANETPLRVESTQAGSYIRMTGTGGTAYVGQKDGGLSFQSASAERMVIDSSGRVSIGTTANTFKLNVESASSTTTNLKSTSPNSSLRLTNSGGLAGIGSEANDLLLSTSTNERMRIDSVGNVGIGTDSPVSYQSGPALNIGNTAVPFAQLNFTTATDGIQYIAFGDATTGNGRYQGLISFDHSTNEMGFGTNASTTQNMTIDSSGNVGINETNPSSLLHLTGSGSAASALIQSTSGGGGLLQFKNTSAPNGFYAGLTGAFTGDAILFHEDAKDIILSTDATERMRIDALGNVGIGTDDPRMALEISGTAPFGTADTGGLLTVRNTATGADAAIKLYSVASNSGSGNNGAISFDAGADGTGASNRLNFTADAQTSTAPMMTISGSGNVGIGTDTPAGNSLTIDRPGIARLRLAESGVRSWDMEATGGEWRLNNATNSKEVLRIDATGNVGIGTSQPGLYNANANDLVVGLAGTGGNRGLTIASGSTSLGTIAFANGPTGNDLARQFIRADHNDGAMLFATGAGEKMRIDASGNLLVGRTSLSAASTDHGTQLYSTGEIYQFGSVTGSSDIHRWYNGSGSLVATINGRGEGFFLGGATYSGPLKADEIIQDGAPVVDSLQIIRAFMKLRAATADPDSTVEELREKLKTAVDDIIDQFQDQIDNMPTPLED